VDLANPGFRLHLTTTGLACATMWAKNFEYVEEFIDAWNGTASSLLRYPWFTAIKKLLEKSWDVLVSITKLPSLSLTLNSQHKWLKFRICEGHGFKSYPCESLILWNHQLYLKKRDAPLKSWRTCCGGSKGLSYANCKYQNQK
jgi:hypothetical protein